MFWLNLFGNCDNNFHYYILVFVITRFKKEAAAMYSHPEKSIPFNSRVSPTLNEIIISY
jgi:hypothetical protein